jgi:hypothetical protein
MNNINLTAAAKWLNDVGIRANMTQSAVLVNKEDMAALGTGEAEVLQSLRDDVCKRLAWNRVEETTGWYTLDCY